MLIKETENWPNVRIRNWGMRNKKKIVVLAVLANYKPLISSTSQWEERTLAEGNSLTSQTEQSYLKYSTNVLASNKSKILQSTYFMKENNLILLLSSIWLVFHSITAKAFQIFCLQNTKGVCSPLKTNVWKTKINKLNLKLNQISWEETWGKLFPSIYIKKNIIVYR